MFTDNQNNVKCDNKTKSFGVIPLILQNGHIHFDQKPYNIR